MSKLSKKADTVFVLIEAPGVFVFEFVKGGRLFEHGRLFEQGRLLIYFTIFIPWAHTLIEMS